VRACVFVCLRAWMCVCVHACIHTFMHAYTHARVCMHAFIACMNVCMHACMHACVHACVLLRACMHTCVLPCVRARISIKTHKLKLCFKTHTPTHKQTCVLMYRNTHTHTLFPFAFLPSTFSLNPVLIRVAVFQPSFPLTLVLFAFPPLNSLLLIF